MRAGQAVGAQCQPAPWTPGFEKHAGGKGSGGRPHGPSAPIWLACPWQGPKALTAIRHKVFDAA